MSNRNPIKRSYIGGGLSGGRLLRLALVTIMLPSCLLAQEEGETHIGMPTDWSHRHMVFSAPRSPREALDLSRNPRYVQQWLRRNIERRHRSHGDLKSDWSVSMGAGATVGAGQYPAKYTLNPTTDSCASDFVVFNTSLAGATGQASIIAYNNLYSGCSGTVPSVYWAYDTGGTIGTSVTFSADGSQLAFVQAEGGKATLVVLKWACLLYTSHRISTIIPPLCRFTIGARRRSNFFQWQSTSVQQRFFHRRTRSPQRDL